MVVWGGLGVVWWWCGVVGGDAVVVGEVWAGIRVAVVLTKEGLGHALPSSNMYDELLLSAKPII